MSILSDKELEAVRCAADGLRNAEIGSYLGISEKSVEARLTRAYRKLGVRSRIGAIRVLQEVGLIDRVSGSPVRNNTALAFLDRDESDDVQVGQPAPGRRKTSVAGNSAAENSNNGVGPRSGLSGVEDATSRLRCDDCTDLSQRDVVKSVLSSFKGWLKALVALGDREDRYVDSTYMRNYISTVRQTADAVSQTLDLIDSSSLVKEADVRLNSEIATEGAEHSIQD